MKIAMDDGGGGFIAGGFDAEDHGLPFEACDLARRDERTERVAPMWTE